MHEAPGGIASGFSARNDAAREALAVAEDLKTLVAFVNGNDEEGLFLMERASGCSDWHPCMVYHCLPLIRINFLVGSRINSRSDRFCFGCFILALSCASDHTRKFVHHFWGCAFPTRSIWLALRHRYTSCCSLFAYYSFSWIITVWSNT